jgi:type II secretory ATPase GspE/PulE/Tfp pilus assembly ATPase PilB-like protein
MSAVTQTSSPDPETAVTPRRSLAEFEPLPEGARQYPLSFCERHRAVLLLEREEEVVVGIAEPVPGYMQDRLARLHGKRVRLMAVGAEELHAWLAHRHLAESDNVPSAQIGGAAARSGPAALSQEEARGTGGAGEALLKGLLEEAAGVGASDIHLSPARLQHWHHLRCDGALIRRRAVSSLLADRLAARLKVLIHGSVGRRRRPQEGRFERRVNGSNYEVRVSILPALRGESISLRLLRTGQGPVSLSDLHFQPLLEEYLAGIAARRDGLFLVTGPTGSGKTTTLHAMAATALQSERRVLTIEDPVEYELDGAVQLQTNRHLEQDFDYLLAKALRHDPDVLLIGEIRDTETARLAVRAALTGHLVFASMHTATVFTAVLRLLDLECSTRDLTAALCGVVSQRLVRRIPVGTGRIPLAAALSDPEAGRSAAGLSAATPSAHGPSAHGPRTEVRGEPQRVRAVGRDWLHSSMLADARRAVEQGITNWREVMRVLPQLREDHA